MGLYILGSANIERDLLESLSLNTEEKEALQEAILLETEGSGDDLLIGKTPKEIEQAAGRAFYARLQKDKDSLKAFDQIMMDRDDYTREKLRREIEHAPKTWVASKIAAFRSLYTKLEAELDQEKSMGRTNLLRKIMRICIKVLDWLAFRMQKLGNKITIGPKGNYAGDHVNRYRNREYNGRVRAIQKKIGIAVNDNLTYHDDYDA